jgi:hypothetical protein
LRAQELRNLWEQRRHIKWSLPCEEFDVQQSLLLLEDCSGVASSPLPGWEEDDGLASENEPISSEQVSKKKQKQNSVG